MKSIIIKIALIAGILLPAQAPAELLIYKGVGKENFTGPDGGIRINWKFFVIIDHASGLYNLVSYAAVNGIKHYSISHQTNTHIVQVSGPKGKMFTAITHIPTECEAAERPGKESVSFDGADATLKVGINQTTSFPRVFSDHGMGLSHSTSSGRPYLSDGSATLVFSQSETTKSNSAGETLDAALDRAIAYVESLGYTPVVTN